MAPKLELVYFDIAGRAEPLRLICSIGNVEFTDTRLSKEEWVQMKPQTPYGQLPILKVEGKTIAESNAISRYLGRLGKLYPEDPLAALECDEIGDVMEDLGQLVVASMKETDNAKKMEMRNVFLTKEFPTFAKGLEARLKEHNGDYFLGQQLTIADIKMYTLTKWFSMGVLDGIPQNFLDDYPVLKRHSEIIDSLPKVKEWNSKCKQQK